MQKSGWKTTEFWAAVIPQVISVLVVGGILTTGQAADLTNSLFALGAAIVFFVASVWPLVEYIKSRAKVKAAAVDKTK